MNDEKKWHELIQAEDEASLVASGTRPWEWWFNVLLADQEPMPEGLFD